MSSYLFQIKKIKREIEDLQSGGGTQAATAPVEAPSGTAAGKDSLDALKEKLATAEEGARKYSAASDLLTSAGKKLQGAAGSLQITQMSGGMEMMNDMMRPGLRGGRGFRGRRNDFGHTMIEMATVKRAQKSIQEAGGEIQKAMTLVPTIPFIKPATVKGAMSGVVLNALLMPGFVGDIMQQAKVKQAKAEVMQMAKECQMAQEWCQKSYMAANSETVELKTTIKMSEMNVFQS